MTETIMQRPEPPSREAYLQFETVDTRWSDNDMYGHVNNAAFYRFFDTAVNRYLIEAGVLNPVESEVIGLVVETGCQFFAPASFPERLELGIKVAKLGTSSVRYELGVFGQADQPGGELAKAAGFFTHVYVDAKTRRPVPLPAGLRDLLERTLT